MLDVAALARLRRLGGERLLTRMVDLCLTTGAKRMHELREGVADRDLSAIEMAAHALSSSAGNVGARAVQELARRIEIGAAEARHAELTRLVAELNLVWNRTEASLRHEQLKASGGD